MRISSVSSIAQLFNKEMDKDNIKYELQIDHKGKGGAFGSSFLTVSEDSHFKSKYTVKCTSDCHFIVFSRKVFLRIKDRIFKKQMLGDLKFMR